MTPGGDLMPRNAKWTGNKHTRSKETLLLFMYTYL